MKAQGRYADHFMSDIDSWKNKLVAVADTTEIWSNVQSNWK